MRTLITGVVTPESGDVVLARVDEVHKQKRLELTDGRKAMLFPGDEIIVCYGNRYAPDQYEAVIGNDLSSCDLIAAGGVAARELSRNLRMIEPTHITPIGLLGDAEGNRLNVRSFAVPDHADAPAIPSILSLGTSMNAGKTLTATSLVRGLKSAGYRVAAIKATGTGAGNDMWIVRDAGADVALDFTDAGYAGTYLIPQSELEAATRRLIAHAGALGCDIAVVEVADGLQHIETSALIEAKHLWSQTVGVVFAAYDAMGAKCGVDLLRALGHRVLAISGRIALSPLAMREAERATGLRVYTPFDLQEGALVPVIASCAWDAVVQLPSAGASRQADRQSVAAAAPGLRPQEASVVAFPSAEARGLPARGAEILDGDTQRELLAVIAARVMAREMDAACNAAPGSRKAGRTNRRNGYRRRIWTTRIGDIALRVPKLRRGIYRPAFLTKAPEAIDLSANMAAACAPNAPLGALSRLLSDLGMPELPEAALAELQAELRARQGVISLPMNGRLAVNGMASAAFAVEGGGPGRWSGGLGLDGESDSDDEDELYSPFSEVQDLRGSVQRVGVGFDADPFAD
jgi:hypothetical protein